jgi:hypothetical protein
MIFETLTGTAAAEIDPEQVPWPKDAIVVYARSNGDIVGRSALLQFPHIEGTWVRENERGSTLAYRLVTEVENVVRQAGRTHVWAFAHDSQPEVGGYLERIGYRLQPMKLYLKEL